MPEEKPDKLDEERSSGLPQELTEEQPEKVPEKVDENPIKENHKNLT